MSASPSPVPEPSAMSLSLVAEPEAASVMRRAVAEFAHENGATDVLVMDIALAVSEAVTNVILHAYRDASRPGDVTVEAERDGDLLHVLVSDDGPGITPRVDSPGLGAGIALIGRVAQSLDVSDRNGGAQVQMAFNLPR